MSFTHALSQPVSGKNSPNVAILALESISMQETMILWFILCCRSGDEVLAHPTGFFAHEKSP